MSYQRPNNRGLFLGRVDEVRDGAAYLKSAHALAEGDVLEFWTRQGQRHADAGAGAHPTRRAATICRWKARRAR